MNRRPTYEELEKKIEKLQKVTKRTQRLNLVLRTIRNVNKFMIQEKDRDALVRGICGVLAETRGYHNV